MSIQHATRSQLKWVRDLHRSRQRHEEQLFIAEGIKVVEELVASELNVKAVFGTDPLPDFIAQSLPDESCFHVSGAELERISTLKTPNRILAIATIPSSHDPVVHTPPESILALDHLSDPGNLGTIIRTAAWFGVRNIICSVGSADCWSPKVVQSAMGALFRMNIYYDKLSDPVFRAIHSNGYRVMAATLDGAELTAYPSEKPFFLIIGSEAHGISHDILSQVEEKVKIPGDASRVESLNAAVAAGILLYNLTFR